MPTNNKTSLGLNSWIGTDKPMRSDFVADNTQLDSLLTSHFSNTEIHLSQDDRTLLTKGFVVGNYCGNGAATQIITMPFAPRVVILFFERMPAEDYFPGGGYNESNFAIITKIGGSSGVFLTADKLTVCQTQSAPTGGGIFDNLNSDTVNYIYVAFR